jgi:crotonobetainyl-CoA:carnitine CoA-transferase CaiB-like acyl-CoA transferase
LKKQKKELPFAPRYGQHNDVILREAGLSKENIKGLRERGVIT